MSFFTDAMGDSMISGGRIKLRIRKTFYDSGFSESQDIPQTFWAKKSIQPLEPEEAQLRGFPDETRFGFSPPGMGHPAGTEAHSLHFQDRLSEEPAASAESARCLAKG